VKADIIVTGQHISVPNIHQQITVYVLPAIRQCNTPCEYSSPKILIYGNYIKVEFSDQVIKV